MFFLIRGRESRSVASKLIVLLFFCKLVPTAVLADASSVFQQTQNSIAIVVNLDSEGNSAAQGSGVVMQPGLVVTNWHVIEGAERVSISNGHREVDAAVLRASAEPDLALLRVDTAALGLSPIELSKQIPGIGAHVYAIGTPHGLEKTFSDGIISGTRSFDDYSYIQTTADISPGSSGGALVDNEGRLIGITTFKFGTDGGLNFAVPTEYVLELEASNYNTVPEARHKPTEPLLISGSYIMATKRHSITLFNPADIAISGQLVAFTASTRICKPGDVCGLELRSRKVLNCLSETAADIKINAFNYRTGERHTDHGATPLSGAEWKNWPDASHDDYSGICRSAKGSLFGLDAIKHTHNESLEDLKCDLLSRDEIISSELKIEDGKYQIDIGFTRLGERCAD